MKMKTLMSEDLTNLVYIYFRMPELLLPSIFTDFKERQTSNSDCVCSWLVFEPLKVYKRE